MPFVSYLPDPGIPGSGTAIDDRGRAITVIESDIPEVRKLPAPAAPVTSAAPAAPLGVTSVGAAVAPSITGPAPAPGVTPRVQQLLDATHAAAHGPTLAPASGIVKAGSQTSTTYGAPKAALDAFAKSARGAADDLATQAEQQGAAKTERAQETVQARAGANVGDFMQASNAQAEAQSQKAANDAAVAALRAETDAPPDPDRFVNNLGTGTKIGLVIAAALQGAFRGLAHQNNGADSVTSIITQRIAEDIDAQKSQIESGRIRRGNLIAGLVDKGYDLKTAISAATARIQNAAAGMLEQRAAMINTPEAAEQGALLAKQLRAQAEQSVGAAVLANAPRSTSTTTYAATTGGPAAAVQALADEKAQRDLDQLKSSGLTQEEFNDQKTKYSEKAQKNDDLVARAKDVAQALGGDVEVIRDKNGKTTGYKVTGDLDTPHFGDESTRYESALSNLQRADVMGMVREPSAKLQDSFAQATEMPFRDEQKKVRLQQILTMALRERNNLAGGYNEHVVSAADAQKSPAQVATPTLRVK